MQPGQSCDWFQRRPPQKGQNAQPGSARPPQWARARGAAPPAAPAGAPPPPPPPSPAREVQPQRVHARKGSPRWRVPIGTKNRLSRWSTRRRCRPPSAPHARPGWWAASTRRRRRSSRLGGEALAKGKRVRGRGRPGTGARRGARAHTPLGRGLGPRAGGRAGGRRAALGAAAALLGRAAPHALASSISILFMNFLRGLFRGASDPQAVMASKAFVADKIKANKARGALLRKFGMRSGAGAGSGSAAGGRQARRSGAAQRRAARGAALTASCAAPRRPQRRAVPARSRSAAASRTRRWARPVHAAAPWLARRARSSGRRTPRQPPTWRTHPPTHPPTWSPLLQVVVFSKTYCPYCVKVRTG
jgi:hypothetical protein